MEPDREPSGDSTGGIEPVLTFDGTVLVPVADPVDGRETGAELAPLMGPDARAVVVHVIEDAEDALDEASRANREDHAEDIFEATRESLDERGVPVETEILYADDVVEAIFDAAEAERVDAVAFIPRESSRFIDLLTADMACQLIRQASVPVVALPQPDE